MTVSPGGKLFRNSSAQTTVRAVLLEVTPTAHTECQGLPAVRVQKLATPRVPLGCCSIFRLMGSKPATGRITQSCRLAEHRAKVFACLAAPFGQLSEHVTYLLASALLGGPAGSGELPNSDKSYYLSPDCRFLPLFSAFGGLQGMLFRRTSVWGL
jgi:hypothetical protein